MEFIRGFFSSLVNTITACVRPRPETQGTLFVFDFDQTILLKSSDDAMSAAIIREKMSLPVSIRNDYNAGKWEEYMTGLMAYIIFNEMVDVEEIMENVRRLELLPGMETLLRRVDATMAEEKNKFVIISNDSNDLFIRTVLNSLDPPIIPSDVIANNAETVQTIRGKVIIFRSYENQFDCADCPLHMCKCKALLEYMYKEGPFKRVYYVGDGKTDLCPAKMLTKKDTLFVRRGHRLSAILGGAKQMNPPVEIKAKIVYFDNGDEIAAGLKGLCELQSQNPGLDLNGIEMIPRARQP